MLTPLNHVEIRVLGALYEKEKTTPEYYPLSLNALTNACNQKSSREPVMELDQNTVIRALYSLKDKGLITEKHEDNSRVAKYGHRFEQLLNATDQEKTILCLLMLRGPQTPGEIKNRSERLSSFENPAQVESLLQSLSAREDGPYVERMAKQPGQKECRYRHLFSPVSTESVADNQMPTVVPAPISVEEKDEKIIQLEKRVVALEADVYELKKILRKA